MPTLLPCDDNDQAIPALHLKDGGAHTLPITGTAARTARPFDAGTRVIAVYATAAARLRTGGATVAASAEDHYLPSGLYLYLSVSGGRDLRHTHLSVLSADEGDGTLHISELE